MILTMGLSPMIEGKDPEVEGEWLLALRSSLVNCGDGFRVFGIADAASRRI